MGHNPPHLLQPVWQVLFLHENLLFVDIIHPQSDKFGVEMIQVEKIDPYRLDSSRPH